MTNNELYEIIRPIVIAVTGVPQVILADPNRQAPSGVYITVEPQQTVDERGQANVIRTNVPSTTPVGLDDVQVDVRAQVIAQCSINVFTRKTGKTNPGARYIAGKLKQADKRPDVMASLINANVNWLRTSAVQNLSALQSRKWDSRAQIDIFLGYETSDVTTINAIYQTSWAIEDDKANTLETGELSLPGAP